MVKQINRILHKHIQPNANHTLIFICCMHGNEAAGLHGLQRVIDDINERNINLGCNFYAIIGNINAYKKNVRFETKDLNRLWTDEHINNLRSKITIDNSEDIEQLELLTSIKSILNSHDGTFIFTDIHTTSSNTIPFITISDSLENRKVASKFAIPTVLGIEEYLDGPLLSYINEFGYTSLGFEAGQHQDIDSINNVEAFVWLLITKMELIDKSLIPYHHFKRILEGKKNISHFYEIKYRYAINQQNTFKMDGVFNNFESVKKEQVLASHNNKTITATRNGRIFLPLYQNQGEDGFFIVSKISMVWLTLSIVLRKLKFYFILKILPGVSQDSKNKHILIVNPSVAKFSVTKLFHLFGYRKKIKKGSYLYFIRRDREIIPL